MNDRFLTRDIIFSHYSNLQKPINSIFYMYHYRLGLFYDLYQ